MTEPQFERRLIVLELHAALEAVADETAFNPANPARQAAIIHTKTALLLLTGSAPERIVGGLARSSTRKRADR